MVSGGRFSGEERDAIYRVIAARRDVRRGFLPDMLPDELLERLLQASHCAPSVGLMQPSRFVVVRSSAVRAAVYEAFGDANRRALEQYTGERRELYAGLKLEGILEAPVNLCVLCDAGSVRGHGLGRQTMSEAALYSTVCAIQNLWLAARAEGVGVGWVSILDPERLRATLAVPEHILPVAYLCMGFVDEFAREPELERAGWERRIPLAPVVSYEQYADPDERGTKL